MRLSEHADISWLGGTSAATPGSADIGGTNATTAWVAMKNYTRAMFMVILGTWNSSDDLDECRIEQATDSSGTGAKDATSDASGGNYDTDNPIDALGNFVIIEIRGEDLDADSSFTHVRGYVAEGGNSGVDNVGAVLIRYGSQYPQKELQGAASTGAQVYVDTNS